MGRKAFITSDMAHDEKMFDLAQEDPEAAILFPWFITWLDDWGRGLASPKRIKSALFPNIPTVTVERIASCIELYGRYRLMELYSDESHEYIGIPLNKWYRWQTHIRKDKRNNQNSKFPPCPTDINELSENARSHAQQREHARDGADIATDRDLTILRSYDLSDLPKEERDKAPDDSRKEATKEIVRAYEETFGAIRGDLNQIMMLIDYVDQGVEVELIKSAIHRSSQAGNPAKYADSILRNLLRRGIKTLADELETEGATRNAGTKQSGGFTPAVQGTSRSHDSGTQYVGRRRRSTQGLPV